MKKKHDSKTNFCSRYCSALRCYHLAFKLAVFWPDPISDRGSADGSAVFFTRCDCWAQHRLLDQ